MLWFFRLDIFSHESGHLSKLGLATFSYRSAESDENSGAFLVKINYIFYTLSEAWSGVNWTDLMAAQGAFGTDFYDRSILRLKHRVPTIVLVDLS